MKRTNLLLLALAFCLLTSFTIRGQSSTGYTSNSGSYTGHNNYEEEEEEQYYEEEEQTYNYGGGQYEEEEMGSYTYTGQPYSYGQEYEEEYEEYMQENYNYNSGSYSGGSSYSYGQGNSSSGYGSNQGYTGSYNSNSGSGSGSTSNTPKFPTSLLTGFVVDILFLAVDTHHQYIAYHYCSDLFPGYTQCVIYNGTESNSRLAATEMVVSAEIFATLPLAERKLWHSHAYAVKNGLIVLPGLSGDAELQAMAGLINTYGKVVDYWHSTQNFPLGAPQLSYGLAADWQLNNTIINEMDKALNLGTTWLQRKQQRAGLKIPTKIEGADDYLTSGVFPQYVIHEFNLPSNSTK